MITVHTIVKNEENWIWYAINSVIDFVDKILVFDTGSQDKTVKIIKDITSSKIELEEKGEVSPDKLIDLRNEQILRTKTDWFMLLDGDEVWPEKAIKNLINIIKNAPQDKIAVVVRTRNCVGDIYHYLPENRGEYKLLDMKGYFNIRAFRKSPDFKWTGSYPLEAYANRDGPINNQDKKLIFLDKYYWHLTHLKRSSINDDFKKKKRKLELGIKANKSDIPEIFFAKRPDFMPDPFIKPSLSEKLLSVVLTPIKEIKAKL